MIGNNDVYAIRIWNCNTAKLSVRQLIGARFVEIHRADQCSNLVDSNGEQWQCITEYHQHLAICWVDFLIGNRPANTHYKRLALSTLNIQIGSKWAVC